MAYHSAYRGIVKAPNGDFDHFVRQLDTSHLVGGYWRFQSVEDDRCAMAHNFTTPEEVLRVVDSSHLEDSYDDIILRWVRGANDTNSRMALSGTATQHLRTIYELRGLLGLPMSSRGKVPLYPISTNPRLQRYWDAKYELMRSVSSTPARQLPVRPIPSPLTPDPSETGLVHPQPASVPVQGAPEGRNTRARSAKIAKAAQQDTVNNTTPVQQRLGAAARRTAQPAATRPLSGDTALPIHPTNAIGQQQVSSPKIVAPASTLTAAASTGSRNVPSIPRAALAWGLEPSPLPTPSSQGHGISQHNWVYSSVSSSAFPQQQQERNGATNPSQDTVTASSRAVTSSNIPYRSPYPPIASRSSPRHHSPVVAPSGSSFVIDHTQNHVTAPQSTTSPAASTISAPAANSLCSSVAAPTVQPVSSNIASGNFAQTSPSASRDTTPAIPTSQSPEPFLDNLSSPVAPRPSSPPPHIEDALTEEPLATDKTPTDTPDWPASLGQSNELLSEDDTGPQPELGPLDTPRVDTEETGTRSETTETVSDPRYTYANKLEEIPCMDCGEVDGHGWDCHIGNIKFTQNPTILDYRSLADAVELFDPDPWRTHFYPIEPEPEDAETQIRGMAGVIRNEDSYKDYEELHNLPDDFMILLWAFKTSKGVQVVNENDWDSGIGESEIE